MHYDCTTNPKHDDEYDIDGRKINSVGYLIDNLDNIIDIFRGNTVFKNNILEKKYGQVSEIPYIYRSGKLMMPDLDTIDMEFK